MWGLWYVHVGAGAHGGQRLRYYPVTGVTGVMNRPRSWGALEEHCERLTSQLPPAFGLL